MLTFDILTKENADEIIDRLLVKMPEADVDYVGEIIQSLLLDEECEYAVSSYRGCLLIRIFDQKYMFLYPVAVMDDADEGIAAEHIRKYAVKEEIPLIFTDVPREGLSNLLPLFRHANIDAEDREGESFRVRIMSEAALLEQIPTADYQDVFLDEITADDDQDYARLSKDKETNLYWGYDYSADVENPCDSYFREMAENEFYRGVALTFAVRYYGRFVGEASLYSFDLLGGAECSVRILPEYRGEGIAHMTLFALENVAREIGLTHLCATVDEQNIISKKLFDKHFGCCLFFDKKFNYYKEL